uniref:Uncharacterized protein n=1 Tax=Triticum urartu TaxID=4572 RepID=A0A8R7P3D1_TRIUA
MLRELIGVDVLAQHVHDLGLGAGGEEAELGGVAGVGLGERAEVGDGIAAAEALRRRIVGARRLGLPREGAEPDALVAFIDLRAPAPVGLRHHALVLGRRQPADAAGVRLGARLRRVHDRAGPAADALQRLGRRRGRRRRGLLARGRAAAHVAHEAAFF